MAYDSLFSWWYTEKAKWTINEWNQVHDWLSSTRGYWDPYYAGYNPVRYDSPQYAFNQVMSQISPVYGSLYKFGGNQAMMDQYGRNRDWNGIVQHPGSTDYGGWQNLGQAAWTLSQNVTRLYR